MIERTTVPQLSRNLKLIETKDGMEIHMFHTIIIADKIGAHVLRLLASSKDSTVADIIQALCNSFNGDVDQISQDVIDALGVLKTKGVITI